VRDVGVGGGGGERINCHARSIAWRSRERKD
jgi:hypothetical protein